MKTNIKLRVTPEQSEAIQKICFANNIGWFKNSKEVCNTDSPYLFIKDNGLAHCKYRSFYIDATKYTEVDADSFIRTNGTCEEFTCEHPRVNNTTGKCIACGENIDKSEFKSTEETGTKPECNFAKYGFEKPDFECELWKVETSVSIEYIHGLVLNDYAHPMGNLQYHKWNKKTGEVLIGCSSKNLTQIKKPWYETCKFPCLIKTNNSIPVVVHYYENGYVHDYRDNKYCVKQWRLITNDEIEGLKQ